MQKATGAKLFQEIIVYASVNICRRGLKFACGAAWNVEAKQFANVRVDVALWKPKLNVEVHCIGQEVVTVFARSPGGNAIEEGLCT